MPQRWFIRNTSTDPLTGQLPHSGGHRKCVGHVTETIGHVPEFGGHDAETVGHASPKYALALPHANVILAGRGHNAFLGAVFSIAHLIRGEFDALEQVMTEVLAQAAAGLKPLKHLFATSLHEQEIVLVGYSKARDRMHAAVFISKTEAEGFVKTDADESYLSPWTPAWGEPFQVSTPEHARFIAMMQVDNGRAMHPDAPLGGRLLLAEVTKDEIKFSTLARLTERSQPVLGEALAA